MVHFNHSVSVFDNGTYLFKDFSHFVFAGPSLRYINLIADHFQKTFCLTTFLQKLECHLAAAHVQTSNH